MATVLARSTSDIADKSHVAAERLMNPAPSFLGISPDFREDQYKLREALLAIVGSQDQAIPAGFPTASESPAVWNAQNLDIKSITFHLTPQDITELEVATAQFVDSEANFNTIDPDTFLVPTLRSKLRAISRELHNGKGAVVLKGLDPQRYDIKNNIATFAGLCSHIGDKRGRQSAKNDVLTHLFCTRDKTIRDPRPGLSAESLPFHNDHCDILALYVLEPAQTGGNTRWASVEKVYNDIVKDKPQVIQVLAANEWPHEMAGGGHKTLPLLFIDQGRPYMSFTRFALTGQSAYPRGTHVPDLTPEQADALDTIQYYAAKNAVEVPQSRGDIFLINNRALFHARDKIDNPDAISKRHLLRLCLRDTEYGRPLADGLQRRWGNCFKDSLRYEGVWMIDKDAPASFVSNRAFDSAFSGTTADPYDSDIDGGETTGSHG